VRDLDQGLLVFGMSFRRAQHVNFFVDSPSSASCPVDIALNMDTMRDKWRMENTGHVEWTEKHIHEKSVTNSRVVESVVETRSSRSHEQKTHLCVSKSHPMMNTRQSGARLQHTESLHTDSHQTESTHTESLQVRTKLESEESRDSVFTRSRNIRAFRSVSCEESRVMAKSANSPIMPSILLRRKLQRSINFSGNVPSPLK
jgi:hypothetical protein